MRKPKSSSFDLSHEVKMSCGMGKLVPFFSAECLPGDKFNLSADVFMRMAPMLSPVMHRIRLYTHFFFVPYRLLWDNWENFITNTKVGENVPVHPFLSSPAAFSPSLGSLADYFGLPTAVPYASGEKISPFPFLAYNSIFNEFYRDENLVDKVTSSCGDGDIDGLSMEDISYKSSVLRRSWMHDYFTSCLPFAQKGEDVSLPIQNFNDVDVVTKSGFVEYRDSASNPPSAGYPVLNGSGPLPGAMNDSDGTPIHPSNLEAKTSGLQATATTINELRSANSLQRWLEKNARGGTRYIEHILSHFGVHSSDKRLDRPEFIFGDSQNVMVNDVQQTSATEFNGQEPTTTPLATLGGQSTTISSGKSSSYFCEEFGQMVGIMSIMPMTAYQQGLHRSYSRRKPTDYYFPDFANLGEQSVLNKEIFYHASDGRNDEDFGYIPRFAEYRYMNSRVAGDFRSSLDFWHLGRKFSNRPLLNSDFIGCNPDNRIFPVENNEQHLYCHVLNNIRCTRPMPRNPIPSL